MARSQYGSCSPLYLVRGGSETILSSDTAQNGRPDVINSAPFQNFEPGWDAEVDGRGKITFQAVYRHTPGKDFPSSIEICARTGRYKFHTLPKFRARPGCRGCSGSENHFLDCTCGVRSGMIFRAGTRYAPGPAEILVDA